jgi:hypothetical protein
MFLIWFALIGLALALAPAAMAQDKRVALVIGNSEYKETPRLENPRNDAADIAAQLKKLNFTVLEGRDLDKAAMDRLIRDFAEALSGAQVGLFFYAGHGLQVGGQNYLVPVDAKLSTASAIDFEMVRLDLVHRTMEREASTNILMMDACRDNPLSRNLARALGTRSAGIGKGLAVVESGEGTLISFSTQPGNVALDGAGRNSPYAAAILKHIATPGEDLPTILINVRNDVMQETGRRQVPWEHSALTAKFYFTAPQATMPGSLTPQQIEHEFWASVKDSTTPSVLGTYLERYPKGEFSLIARALVEYYERQQRKDLAPKVESSKELAEALQRELQRVGCYRAEIDGVWGSTSRLALADFNRHAMTSLLTDAPAEATLSALRNVFARICPEAAPTPTPPRRRTTSGEATGKNCRRETRQECIYRVCPAGFGCGLRGSGICSDARRKVLCN